jgi:hypothetical protein
MLFVFKGSTHKNTISELKRAYSLPKNIIEPMVSQLNIIAIKYAMNILLFKKKLENNPHHSSQKPLKFNIGYQYKN